MTINQLAFREFPVFTVPIENALDEAGSLVRVRTEDEEGNVRVLNVPTRTYFKN
jgi:hypothetical protein